MQHDPRLQPAPYMGTSKQVLQSRNPGQPCMNTRHLVQLTLPDVQGVPSAQMSRRCLVPPDLQWRTLHAKHYGSLLRVRART